MAYHKSLAGIGWVSLVPSGTYPDPIHLAEIQSIDLSITEDDADLEDSSGDVIDTFTTKRVIEGTITLQDISGNLLAASTRGGTVAAGMRRGYQQTSTIPTTPFQVTPSVGGGTAVEDLGVVDLTAGKPMTCDATATGTNVYSFSAGTYTFNTADAGHSVLINCRATHAALGTTTDVAAATSSGAYFGLHCYNPLAAKPWGIYVPAARIPGISAKFAKGGWSDVTLKWKATRDSSNKFFYLYSPE